MDGNQSGARRNRLALFYGGEEMPINASAFGINGNGSVDNTVALQRAFDAASQSKETLIIDSGVYVTSGSLNIGAAFIDAAQGAIIEHRPITDCDCIVVTGLDSGRTKLSGLTVRGSRDLFGRDLINVRKGDYVTLENVTLINAKRDAFTVKPNPSYSWVENMMLMNVKVQSPGRDAFHFEVSNVVTNTFINQVTMINCESRAAERHALSLFNDALDTAQKISNFRVINSELACSPGQDAIVRFCGCITNGGFIENISIEDTAIEETSGKRTGAGIDISGKMSGFFHMENSIIFGTASKIVGFDLFPHYHWRDIGVSAYVPLYSSHTGIYKKYRTSTLASGAFEDTHTLVVGEELEGTVFDRYNTSGNAYWYAKFVTYGTNVFVQHAVNVDVSVVNGKLRITNTDSKVVPLEVFLRRTIKDTSN